jgi:hypothetical protein
MSDNGSCIFLTPFHSAVVRLAAFPSKLPLHFSSELFPRASHQPFHLKSEYFLQRRWLYVPTTILKYRNIAKELSESESESIDLYTIQVISKT